MQEIKVYHFGSSLDSVTFNDLDLLIIYKNQDFQGITELITFRKLLCNLIEKQLKVPVDVILLSEEEEKQLLYLNQINHKRIV